ncbi:hypothetical protein AMAG_01935 [Allomyces macrogynus ATCC 38327]|uniref:Uncharacterized protein n=1 Tax=Allomyces macrogynus (strain ATCC 38327) TaxID=578462 RepID=A0A0L0S0L9_ALLM3|nr:hypothetical protein AMAG_01935 [Allomyces macrogynus ATCC 38327]|eukprot:KNE56093.1 hypothetical protein AMAG_01935 [Allomyces macrogynus ATCC 38327]
MAAAAAAVADPVYRMATAQMSRYAGHLAYYVLHPVAFYYDLVVPVMDSPMERIELYLIKEHPFVLSMHVLVAAMIFTFTTGIRTGNYSAVDRIWSIIPVVYAWIYVLQASPELDFRLLAIAGVVTIWGARLTYNFWRKGGYHGEEDYRWAWLRRIILEPYGSAGNVAWQLFHVFFITIYQHVLLWALINPVMLVAWNVRYRPRPILARDKAFHVAFGGYDWIALALCLACIALETIADQQQWEFQTTKYRLLEEAKTRIDSRVIPKTNVRGAAPSSDAIKARVDTNLPPRPEEIVPKVNLNAAEWLAQIDAPYNLGFPTTGLFKYSRHPNFFAEVSLWFMVYLFAVAATATAGPLSYQINYPFTTALSLVLSSDWTTLHVLTHHATYLRTFPLVQWAIAGAVNLALLFQGSTAITERISMAKYPWYRDYQRKTSRFMPLPSGGEVTLPPMADE